MGRIGLVGRIMLILSVALVAAIGATLEIDHLANRKSTPSSPRVVHAAGVILLARDAGNRERLPRLSNNGGLHVDFLDKAPPPPHDMIAAPRLVNRIANLVHDPSIHIDAFTNELMVPKRSGRMVGHLSRATAAFGDGKVLVIDWLDLPEFVNFKLFGLPPSAWAAFLGLGVAALAILTIVQEMRPLRRLTAVVAAFDGRARHALPAPGGAPDLRELVLAVHAMQDRVADLLAERSFLIGAISHDLRTLLTRLRLRTENVDDPAWRERMNYDIDAMTQLIDSSLAFARGTTTSETRREINLGDLVAVEIEEHRALDLSPPLDGIYPDEAVVLGDPVALRRVVGNILDNARRFGREALFIRVDRAGPDWRITVEDDGPGIAEADREAIFDPFFRVDRSRNRDTGGTGLGLAIARQIVTAHGGTIAVDPGRRVGTAFVIHLPARDTASPRDGAKEKARGDAGLPVVET